MATYGTSVRRGLPRTKGGEPWPAAGAAPVEAAALTDADLPVASSPVAESAASSPVAESSASSPVVEPVLASSSVVGPSASSPVVERAAGETKRSGPASARAVRRGLPRVPGGEPWPPASPAAPEATQVGVQGSEGVATTPALRQEATPDAAPVRVPGPAVRRGLPRTPGGEPWPPAGFAPALAAAAQAATPGPAPATATAAPAPGSTADAAPAPQAAPPAPGHRTGLPRPGTSASAPAAPEPVPAAAAASTALVEPQGRAPLPFPQTVFPSANATRWNADRVAHQKTGPIVPPEPVRHGPFTTVQWIGAVIVGGAGLLFAAGMIVLAVRWFVSLDFMRDFLATYPGEYHLPETAPIGLPAWIGWQHFFNVFLMVLIIRSGLQVRHVKRPTAFWAPRGNAKGKISLSLWFHQSLDILWLVNGVIFVVLLFVTGQWMRIVPTSWEVFPNALSAGLQYASLDWPTENGWVNYNALQQLAYFATVFLAAPLAAITGVRMSGIWPKNAKGLNKAYPVEWARAVHFPVMLYFCLFILVHVTLVFATGALRNLNHMYAAQGSVDPNAYADNWAGFWIFAASLAVIAAAWIAARPLVLAPIARLFGTVSGR